MSDWTGGYVADIDYTFGYYTELNTARLRQIFLSAGLAVPEIATACELGFGQGLSTNIHAAASGAQWYGTDFNPSQAAFAQELARTSGANAQLFDQAFAEFSQRADLPEFDYIGLHGIWSWISDANRAVIVDFIARKLKVGGVLYISYNTQPGWASMVPLRDLLTEHKEVMGVPGQGITTGIDNALAFAEKLMGVNPQFAIANPQAALRLTRIKEQDRNYVAHEYFNRDWLPMPFSRMAEWLAPTKLSYAFSAHYLDHVDAANLTPEQQALLKEIPDPMFRETVRDFCVNQQFRRDYWVKGPRKLDMVALAEQQRAQRFVLVQARATVSLKVKGSLGEAEMQDAIYGPVLDILADHRAHSLGELEQALKVKGISYGQIAQAILIMTGNGTVMAAQDEATVASATPACARLNAHLCKLARANDNIGYLASPLVGGGVPVSRFAKLFLLARAEGKPQPSEWAAYAWSILSARGERLLKDGKAIESPADNQSDLNDRAAIFATELLPILQALHIA